MTYYIVNEQEREGPYDLLGIIRKIRNESLHKHHLLAEGAEDTPRELYQFPIFYDVLVEQDQLNSQLEASAQDASNTHISFVRAFKSGYSIITEDTAPVFITVVLAFVAAIIILGMTVALPSYVAAFVAPYLAFLCFSVCLITLLPMSRVQLLSFANIGQTVKHRETALLLAPIPSALTFTVPWILSEWVGLAAWGLVLFPGLLIMAYFTYLPLLITDREMSLGEALKQNRIIFGTIGLDLPTAIIALLAVNIIACGLVLAPLLTLPITFLALIDIYDRHFYEE